MSTHLSPDEVVAALENELRGRRRLHLEGCDPCRALVAEARESIEAARAAGEVPEPSPLFWEHLSARIRHATASEPVPRRGWHLGTWGPLLAGGLAVLVGVVTLRGPGTGDVVGQDGRDIEVSAVESWSDVVAMAGQLSGDDVHGMFQPEGVVLVEELTPAERDVFVQLLEREMETTE